MHVLVQMQENVSSPKCQRATQLRVQAQMQENNPATRAGIVLLCKMLLSLLLLLLLLLLLMLLLLLLMLLLLLSITALSTQSHLQVIRCPVPSLLQRSGGLGCVAGLFFSRMLCIGQRRRK